MQWFYNLKIAAKLILGFVIVALIAGVVGVIGLINLNNISKADTLLYEENTLGLDYAGNAAIYYQRIRFNAVKMIAVNDVSQQDTCINNIKDETVKSDEFLKLYEDGIITKTDRNQFNALKPQWEKYKSLIGDTVGFVQAGKNEQAKNLILGDVAAVGNSLEESFGKLSVYNSTGAKDRSESNTKLANTAMITVVIVIIAAMLIAIILGLFISNIISKPVRKLTAAADNLAQGNINVLIDSDSKDEIGNLSKSFKMVIQNINSIMEETDKLVKASEIGRLDIRGNESQYKGAWSTLLNGMNRTLDTLVSHIDSMPAPVMIIDRDFSIQYMNKAGADLLGTQQSQLIGAKCYDQFKTSDCHTNKCACGRALQEGRKATSETDAHPRGLNLDISYTGIPIRDEKDKIIGAIELVVDQTAIKTAARVAQKQADYQEKEVAKLIVSLDKLSEGNLKLETEVASADNDTKSVYENFVKIQNALNSTTNAIRSYIGEIARVLTDMSKGNFDVGINEDFKGDFTEIKDNLNSVIKSFNEVLGSINSASEQVASGARQVSDSSMALSQGATEQASSIEELTASLEEISSQTKLNAQNANQANELAETAKSNAVQGNAQMKEMLKAMEEINDSSTNISKIIKVIDEIAFQTNILALNAAVEAARAGQHGKGFAVVAEEVRNLAARSANAAKETTDMIEGSIKKVEGGTRIANDTANALNKIVEGVAKAATLVGDIAVASNEQATGIAQINQGIMQVSQVVQTNSATSEESAAASEELSSQAEFLRESVGKFKLNKVKQTYSKFDEFNPEVLKMLEDMSQGKKANLSQREVAINEAAASKPKIVLNDKEFGKY